MVIRWLERMLWRYVACKRFNGGHKRDWNAWDAKSIARCLHCHSKMVEPGLPPRRKL